MNKRIYILASKDSDHHKVEEASQILQEYDYDVVNPTIIQDWERMRVDFMTKRDWIKRDALALLNNCDGIAVIQGIETDEHMKVILAIAKSLPWIGFNDAKSVEDWVADAIIGDEDDD